MRKQLFFLCSFSLSFMLFVMACGGYGNRNADTDTADTLTTVSTAEAVDSLYFFSGEFQYMADAANILDCATGAVMLVSTRADYLEAERRYTGMKLQQGQRAYIEFMGRVVTEPSMEEGQQQKAYVIERLLQLGNGSGCNPDKILTGTYESGNTADPASDIYSLTLQNDYTCSVSFNRTTGTETFRGTWYRTTENQAVILIASDNLQRSYQADINYGTRRVMLVVRNFEGENAREFSRRID